MTREEHERLYALVQNPPPGSKMEAAKMYGADLTLNLHSLTRTPTERVREMEAALRLAEQFASSGGSPGSMIDFEATLKMLSERGVNFVVIGGYAATLHGSAYLTRDLEHLLRAHAGKHGAVGVRAQPLSSAPARRS